MRRTKNGLLTSLKDQVREVRYSIRAEAEAPGSTLPKVLQRIELGPLIAIGTPALWLADGIFSHVETIATKVLKPVSAAAPVFPRPIGDYAQRETSLSDQLYEPYKDMLRSHGVRAMVVSEQAIDDAWNDFWLRHGDTFPQLKGASMKELVRTCAGFACALIDARPIRRVTYDEADRVRPHFMLSPNIYCGLMVGLATAIASLKPDLVADEEATLESVDSVVDARFLRFKLALGGKSPAADLARDFEAIVPFLP